MEHISRTVNAYMKRLRFLVKRHNGKPRGVPVKSCTKEK